MKWNVTRLIAVGSLAVLWLALSLVGATLPLITGIPGASGLINIFVGGIMYAVCCLVIPKFGAAMLMGFVFSVLAIPVPLMGTPGFAPKILIGISSGLIGDLINLVFRKARIPAAILIGGMTNLAVGLEIVGLGYVFGVAGIERAAKFIVSVPGILGMLVGGGIAGYFGWIIYSRLRTSAVVMRIQGPAQEQQGG